MKERKIHQGISMLKGIACIIVVILHVPFPGIVRKVVAFSMNFSVPIFFMVTGFFAYKIQQKEWVIKKIKSLIKMILYSELLYGIWQFISECMISGTDYKDFFATMSLVKRPLKVLFFGSAFNGVFWYLYAMLWTYVLYLLLLKFDLLKKNITYLLIPVLAVTGIFGRAAYQNYHILSEGMVFLFRNAVFVGLPMTLLGSWIAMNYNKLLNFFNPMKSFFTMIFAGLLMVIEYFISHTFLNNPGMDFHISTIVLAFGLFMFALNYETVRYKNLIEYIGNKLYMWVYLTHIFVSDVFGIIFEALHIENNAVVLWIKPIVVIVFSCLLGEAISFTIKKVKKK